MIEFHLSLSKRFHVENQLWLAHAWPNLKNPAPKAKQFEFMGEVYATREIMDEIYAAREIIAFFAADWGTGTLQCCELRWAIMDDRV